MHADGPQKQEAKSIHEGKWNGLSGKFEAVKMPEVCVIREVYEESGLTIRNPKLCGLLMFPKCKGNDWYIFVFTAMESGKSGSIRRMAGWNGFLMRRN